MALSDWLRGNQNATPQEISDAINAHGGLTQDAINAVVQQYGSNPTSVQTAYNELNTPGSLNRNEWFMNHPNPRGFVIGDPAGFNLGPVIALAAAVFGAPLVAEAIGATGAEATALGDMAATGAGGGVTAGGIGGVEGAAAAQAAVDAANATNTATATNAVTNTTTPINAVSPTNVVTPTTGATGTPLNAVSPTTVAPYTGPSADSLAADNIDVGGGFNPATGTGDAATRAAAAATGVTSSASIPYGATSLPGQTVNFTNPTTNPITAPTTVSSLLTPGNALLAKGLLDTVGSNKAISGINSAAAIQQAAYDQSKKDLAGLYANQQGYQKPYMATGTNALSNLGALGTGTYQMYDEQGNPTGTGTGSGYLQHQFDATDLAKGLAPNYDFMLQQGQMANQRAANMAGGGFGGNALQGLNKYTQDYAGTAYQQAFKNYQDQRQNIFGDLSKLADVGQGAANQLTGATGTYGTNLTNLNVGNAAAQAAAQVAAAQTAGTNLSNLANTGVVATLLNQNPDIAKVTLKV